MKRFFSLLLLFCAIFSLHSMQEDISTKKKFEWSGDNSYILSISILVDECGQQSNVGSCYICFIKNENEAYIQSIDIQEKYRKKGYGSILLKNTLNFIKEKYYLKVTLEVDSQKQWLISWYQKYGFVVLEEKKNNNIFYVKMMNVLSNSKENFTNTNVT